MVPLTVATARIRPDTNQWMVSLYAGVFTAVVTLILVLVAGVPALPGILGLLLGAAPILAYQVAKGTLGQNWKPVIAGVLGFILFVVAIFLPAPLGAVAGIVLALLSMIIWPLVVGAMLPEQSLGRLFLASLIGLVLAVVVFLIVGLAMGQDPYGWLGFASILAMSAWGGTVGAALSAWAK